MHRLRIIREGFHEDEDLPTPIDFNRMEDALKWIEDTNQKRPWRLDFFRAIASQIKLRSREPANIAELGSGPGFLAEEVMMSCEMERYVLLDFSKAMHDLARQRLMRFNPITA